jgi:hypothetical protein
MNPTEPRESFTEKEEPLSEKLADALSHALKPACPRDNHLMHFETKGISWSDRLGQAQFLPSYHCHYMGCSVRYHPLQGYFTVVKEPEEPYFIEEPGTNILRCPRHETWLYRRYARGEAEFLWLCGVEDCDYTRADLIPGHG